MAHIDFLVENLDEAVAHALKCGATKSEVQYYERRPRCLTRKAIRFVLVR